MLRVSPNRRSALLLLVAAFTLVAACGSDDVGAARLRDIETGVPLASVADRLGQGPLSPSQSGDSLRLLQGYRMQQFIVNGQNYRVLWYREQPGSLAEPIQRDKETPILFNADTVIAVGWRAFTNESLERNIPNPLRDRERLDSISRSQSKR